jgi:hypothetical protein
MLSIPHRGFLLRLIKYQTKGKMTCSINSNKAKPTIRMISMLVMLKETSLGQLSLRPEGI